MCFSTDRDLLIREPMLFNDVPFVSQQPLKVTDGVLLGATLSSEAADFTAAGIDAGAVLLLHSVAVEVVERVDSQTLTVSVPRSSADGDAIAPWLESTTGVEIVHRTYRPQAAIIRDTLLRMVGINPDDAAASVTADMIVSLSVMRELEALGTLEQVYSSALAAVGDYSNLAGKAQHYRAAFGRACRAARVQLDTDGDGRADLTQRLGVIRLRRV